MLTMRTASTTGSRVATKTSALSKRRSEKGSREGNAAHAHCGDLRKRSEQKGLQK